MARNVGAHNVTWYSDELTQEVKDGANRGLKKAVEHLKERLVSNVGTLGPPRSLPGGFPHIDSGELHGSFKTKQNKRKLTARVGTNVEHAHYLEFGTENMAPRPFLNRTLQEEKDAVTQDILSEIEQAIRDN